MPNFPLSPRIAHGGFVTVDPHSLKPPRIIPFQYNPETLSRTLSPGASSAAGSTGPSGTTGLGSLGSGPGTLGGQLGTVTVPTPTGQGTNPAQFITFSLLLDATDQLQFPDQNPVAVRYGVYPLLSAIEDLLYPPQSSTHSLTLFVWGAASREPVSQWLVRRPGPPHPALKPSRSAGQTSVPHTLVSQGGSWV